MPVTETRQVEVEPKGDSYDTISEYRHDVPGADNDSYSGQWVCLRAGTGLSPRSKSMIKPYAGYQVVGISTLADRAGEQPSEPGQIWLRESGGRRINCSVSSECLALWLDDVLPLHYALTNKLPAPIIKGLVGASPDTVSWPDVGGHLPLHWALSA